MIAQPRLIKEEHQVILSADEYLVWESQQEEKYEYENGEIVAMTGGSIPHSQIPLNLGALMLAHFRGKGCKISISDAKVLVRSRKYYYPDLVVSCDDRDRFSRDFLQYPVLIAEVLSPTTEARDRGIKQQSYMAINTLQAYILIDSERPIVEVYQRHSDRAWEYQSIAIEETTFEQDDPLVHITSIDLQFRLSALYENVDFLDSSQL